MLITLSSMNLIIVGMFCTPPFFRLTEDVPVNTFVELVSVDLFVKAKFVKVCVCELFPSNITISNEVLKDDVFF